MQSESARGDSIASDYHTVMYIQNTHDIKLQEGIRKTTPYLRFDERFPHHNRMFAFFLAKIRLVFPLCGNRSIFGPPFPSL